MLPTYLPEYNRFGDLLAQALVFATLVLSISACNTVPKLSEWNRYPSHVEHDVPWFPEDRFQCGPQSLASMLNYSGITSDPASLKDDVYVPGKQGSFAPEIRAAARTRARLPYKIDASLDGLMHVISDGYPVLILQNVGLGFAPVWHFAVVIGFDRAKDVFILRTGPHYRYEMSSTKFERRWRLADYWAITLLGPDDFPGWVERQQFEAQLASMENQWQSHMEAIYQRMLTRWPESTMALLGLGNIAYGNGDVGSAGSYYDRALSLDNDHIAVLDNLAQVRFELDDYAAAERLICRAKRLAAGHPLEPLIASTEAEFRAASLDINCRQADQSPPFGASP